MSISISLALTGLLLLPAEATATAAPAGDDTPVAIVDGKPLSRAAYKEFLLAQFGAAYLDVFVNEQILADLAKKEGVAVTEKDASDWIEDRLREAQGIPDYQGMDLAKLRQEYKPHAKTGCLIERLIKARRASGDGLRREYELRYGEKRKARHILIRTGDGSKSPTQQELDAAKKKADDLAAQIEKGADFAALAKKESQDVGSAPDGGELPEFNRLDVVAEFSDTAFKLKEGEVSKPIRSEFGYHIIQVTKIIPPAKPFDEKLGEELKVESLKRPVDREEVSRFLSEIRKGAKVERKLE